MTGTIEQVAALGQDVLVPALAQRRYRDGEV
jgi:hypothetical protein